MLPVALTALPHHIERDLSLHAHGGIPVSGAAVDGCDAHWAVAAGPPGGALAPVLSDCVQYTLQHLAGRIVRCLGRVWFRDDGYQWHSGKETTLRLIAAAIEQLPMFVETKSGFASISRNVGTPF